MEHVAGGGWTFGLHVAPVAKTLENLGVHSRRIYTLCIKWRAPASSALFFHVVEIHARNTCWPFYDFPRIPPPLDRDCDRIEGGRRHLETIGGKTRVEMRAKSGRTAFFLHEKCLDSWKFICTNSRIRSRTIFHRDRSAAAPDDFENDTGWPEFFIIRRIILLNNNCYIFFSKLIQHPEKFQESMMWK